MRPPRAFTLIELIVVMTIISLLSAFAMVDYGTSIKKARLQVATEEVILILQDAGVRAQSSPDGVAKCFTLNVPMGGEPILSSYAWNDGCSFPGGLADGDLTEEEDLDWEKISIMKMEGDGAEITDDLWFVFVPPDGDIVVYDEHGSFSVSTVDVTIVYNNSTEPIFQKTVGITPVTASFVIY
jgi:prepilin-type N-terminal cleavage/methylation domain-containing protein